LAAGGLLMAIGALLPWQVIGSLLFVAVNGVATWKGWLVFALGLLTVATAGFLLMTRKYALRLAVAAGSLVFGALVIAVAVQQFHHIRGQNTVAIREGITKAIGRPPTRQQMATAKDVVKAFGLWDQPWAGLYVCAAGGGLAITGAIGAVTFGNGSGTRTPPGTPSQAPGPARTPIG
jgi:hypothetical protein